MQDPKPQKMRHMSFVLPPLEHEAFRFLCCRLDISPSEALRSMVRVVLSGRSFERDEPAIKGGTQ